MNMIVCATVGQWVTLTKSQLIGEVVAPAGTQCEITKVTEQGKDFGNITLYDVRVLGTEDHKHCLNYTELEPMTLVEIASSIYFTF